MSAATIIGLALAIILILALMVDELALIFANVALAKVLSTTGACFGLLLAIVASAFVLYASLDHSAAA